MRAFLFCMKGGGCYLKLTIKQQKFADYYIESGNATQSAIKAGYAKGVSGRENLQNPTVKAYIDDKLAQLESDKIADLTEALQGITRIARGEETEQVVTVNPITGDPEVTEVPVKVPTRLAAWKEIIKRYPNSDKLLEAELRLKIARARVEEAKAKALEDSGVDVERALDGVIDVITGVAKDDGQTD